MDPDDEDYVLPPDPEPWFTAIGYFVVVWSQLEHALQSYIIAKRAIPEAEQGKFRAYNTARELIRIGRATANDNGSAQWAEIFDEAEKLREHRNDIVHGAWRDASDGLFSIRTQRPYFVPTEQYADSNDINAKIETVRHLIARIEFTRE